MNYLFLPGTPNVTLVSENLGILYLSGPDLSDFNEVYPNFSETFPEIQWIDIRDSGLTELPNITTASKLTLLNLKGNKIRMRNGYAHHGLPTDNVLEQLVLERNPDFGANLSSTFFQNLPRLKVLSLQYCGLTKFPDVSGVIDTLTTLLLGGNDLTVVDPNSLIGQNSFNSSEAKATTYPLTDLRVAGAKLREFPNELFTLFPNLVIVHMNGQEDWYTGKLPDFSLVQNTLQDLFINNNYKLDYRLDDFTKMFKNMRLLDRLVIDWLYLEEFPFPVEFILDNFPALRILSMRGNTMKTIPDLSRVAALHTVKPLTVSLCSRIRDRRCRPKACHSAVDPVRLF